MADIIFKEESYKIIGACMEVHNQLGMGFKEAVYKDVLELEFKNKNLSYTREKMFCIEYKGIILNNKYFADFVILDSIILEVKASSFIVNNFIAQLLTI